VVLFERNCFIRPNELSFNIERTIMYNTQNSSVIYIYIYKYSYRGIILLPNNDNNTRKYDIILYDDIIRIIR